MESYLVESKVTTASYLDILRLMNYTSYCNTCTTVDTVYTFDVLPEWLLLIILTIFIHMLIVHHIICVVTR